MKETMKRTRIGRALMMLCLAGLAVVLLSQAAFPWGAATHAYMEEHLLKKLGQTDSAVLYNRIYGANAIDIFNNNFIFPYVEFQAFLHDTARGNFLKAWEVAESKDERAFAYGFVSHNNTWGMDSSAHVSGVTYGRGEGYVIAKARVLAAMLGPALEAQLGVPLPEEVLINVGHYLVESGVDLLVRAKDPAIGSKLTAAAFYRSGAIPTLLVNAYTDDLSALAAIDAAPIILVAEGNFRASMMAYGFALTQDNALDLVAAELAAIGVSYLGLPSGSEALLTPIAKQGIGAAMTLCAPDFERELHASTGRVNGGLSSHGIAW